jgi:hypothetical protein
VRSHTREDLPLGAFLVVEALSLVLSKRSTWAGPGPWLAARRFYGGLFPLLAAAGAAP